jgi:hypothetical protein
MTGAYLKKSNHGDGLKQIYSLNETLVKLYAGLAME